ncbi:MAG TPA: hypothetical protein VNZ53_19265 [Steroidobacteraceae bacterium]|jgi:hypothetical protein|nr:hypothetical protein [Steroidobacteraceae bacterium]
MTEVTAREIAVVSALKHAIVTSGSPGLSVNTHPNAFFLNVIGEVDLLKGARAALAAADQYEKVAAKQAQQAEPAKAVADPDGHG